MPARLSGNYGISFEHCGRKAIPFAGRLPCVAISWIFVCYSHRLVIEVDGSQHGAESQAEHDALRDKVLSREGFSTVRFQAVEVMQNLEGAAIMIRQALATPSRIL
jgi:very-short-patch-repair endonuclease